MLIGSNISAQQTSTYEKAIDLGDELFSEYKLNEALSYYNKALTILPNDSYAQGKIDHITEIKADLITTSPEFNQLITDGIISLNNKRFAESRKLFKNARKIFPNNKEVKVLLDKVKLAEKNYYYKQELFSKEVELAYNYLKDSNYIYAIKHLKIAQEIEPSNWAVTNEIKNYYTLAKKQHNLQSDSIKIISTELVNTSNKNIEINPISVSDNFALSIQSNEPYNTELLLSEIEKSIDRKQSEINNINKKIQEETNIAAINTRKFNTTITNADRLFKMKSYAKAIESYRNASHYLPNENYPKEMESKIINMMENNIVTEICIDKVLINSDTTKVFAFEPVSINVRRSNYIFMKATNISGNSFKIIVSYGSNNGKNGGFVVQIPEGNQYTEYIIRVGNQYKWFADDNNWISILPEKGDIEIDLIRISKSN